MKTMKLRLLATMITLAAVTITTINPAIAQRRSTSSETGRSEQVLKSENKRKSTVQKKRSNNAENTRSNSATKSIRQSTQEKRSPAPATAQRKIESSNISSRTIPSDNRSTKVMSGTINQSNKATRNSAESQVTRNTSKSSANATINNRSSSNERRD